MRSLSERDQRKEKRKSRTGLWETPRDMQSIEQGKERGKASSESQGFESVRAAITKYYRLGGLNNKHSFFTVLDAEKTKIKVLADQCQESPLPDL